MTTDDFGSVDIDLLADYIGDALDDDERERVAGLVADDPQWRSAFALLSPGMSQVGAELSAMGAASEPMPADFSVRLEAAFAAEFSADAAATPDLIDASLAEPTGPHTVPSTSSPAASSRGDRHLVSVPSGSGAKGAPRRRRLRWAAPIAAAAGVLAFAGFGTTYLTGRNDAQESTAGSAADSAGESSLVSGLSSSPIASSGTDYSATTLASEPGGTLLAPKMPGFNAQSAAPGVGTASTGSAEQDDGGSASDKREGGRPNAFAAPPAAPELARLQDQPALLACLEEIARENAAGPIAVQSVDFARFAGAPAVVVRFSAGSLSWAWAAGPDCGSPGYGAQLRERVRVG